MTYHNAEVIALATRWGCITNAIVQAVTSWHLLPERFLSLGMGFMDQLIGHESANDNRQFMHFRPAPITLLPSNWTALGQKGMERPSWDWTDGQGRVGNWIWDRDLQNAFASTWKKKNRSISNS